MHRSEAAILRSLFMLYLVFLLPLGGGPDRMGPLHYCENRPQNLCSVRHDSMIPRGAIQPTSRK